ncbi:probable cytochrome P450 6a20 [Episyrphus balteatus]|uniref:probable cytochrome P450 6a20 n=1 Tax=Episyrphus balteatus TaxID=286459 RepID=UPI002486C18D|nr:probable cytochrome P450 6a20 [Episyrphus balteatus]
MAISGVFIYIVLALVSALVYFIRQHMTYWKRRGIPHDPPDFPSGNLKGFRKTHHLRDLTQANYEKYKHTGPFGGFYFFLKQAVIVYDLDLAKNILIKDFHNFTDRVVFHNERDDPLTGHLFALDGQKWKHLRNKMSPTFSSGKMKGMFPIVLSVGDRLIEAFDNLVEKDSIVEVKDILARFTVDVIGTCAFGLECNSLKDPHAEFRIMGTKAFTQPRHNRLLNMFIFSFPKLAKTLRMRQIHEEVHQFYMRVVRETVEFREKNSVKRNDFMNLLIDLKNSEEGMTMDEVAAQSFVFFLAGFETSSTTMGFALFELALNQDIQDRLRAEINNQFDKNGGKLTYDSMAEMDYMDKVMKETLRKHSIVTNLVRQSLNEYPTSNPKYVIPKRIRVIIPADSIHRDPEIYPDPEKFDPERFSPEETQKRHPLTWLPFGEGPRNCIGLRFGKMQIYVGLSLLLRNYKFHYCDKTPNPLQPDVKNFLYSAKGGIFLRVERIKF